ncbi:hypothetical protein [Pseudomonas sp. PB3P13]
MNISFFTRNNIALVKSIRTDFAVKVLLIECLQAHRVGPFITYLNTVDVITGKVVASETLFDEALKYVINDELPNYPQFSHEVFRRRYSFASKDRIDGFDMLAFEKIVTRIILELRNVDSVALSHRSIKPVSLEDVHAALKLRVPTVNIDEVFVTGFVEEKGKRKVIQSQTLAEDIYAHFRDNEIPYYYGDQIGIYTVGYSAEEDKVHLDLTARDISNLVIDIIPGFLI